MTRLRVFTSRVLGLFAGRRRDHDLNDEVRAHLGLLADEHTRGGLPPETLDWRPVGRSGE